jgi:hypothetical protein
MLGGAPAALRRGIHPQRAMLAAPASRAGQGRRSCATPTGSITRPCRRRCGRPLLARMPRDTQHPTPGGTAAKSTPGSLTLRWASSPATDAGLVTAKLCKSAKGGLARETGLGAVPSFDGTGLWSRVRAGDGASTKGVGRRPKAARTAKGKEFSSCALEASAMAIVSRDGQSAHLRGHWAMQGDFLCSL